MRFAALSLLALSVAACGSIDADPASTPLANPLGNGLRIADVQNPKGAHHAPNANVAITGASVTWLDNFDETHDGKSRGTLWVQDVGSQSAYAGIGIFSPTFVPSDLRVLPGDVIDFAGPYQELTKIGSAMFPTGQVLPQLAKPVGTFRYEFDPPAAKTVALADLDDYAKGRQWEGMLVTVSDVYAGSGQPDSSGFRVTYPLVSAADAGAPANAVAISNELFDLKLNDYAAGTHFKQVTGIVTWFFSFHIAPRTRDDLVQ